MEKMLKRNANIILVVLLSVIIFGAVAFVNAGNVH